MYHRGGFEKDPEVRLSEEILLAYRGPRERWATEALDDEEFRHGAQWDDAEAGELKLRKQPALAINKIHPAVESLKAALTAHDPKFASTGREGSDMRVGAIFSDIMSFIWDQSKGKVQLKMGVEDFACKGMMVNMAYVDPTKENGKGDVCFVSIDPLEVFFDPNSKLSCCEDSANILIRKVLTDEQILANYPSFADRLPQTEICADTSPTGGVSSKRRGDEGQSVNDVQYDIYHNKRECIDRYTKVLVERFLVTDPVAGWEKVLTAEQYVEYLKKPAFVEITKNAAPRFFTSEAQVAAVQKVFEKFGGVFHYGVAPNDPSGTPVKIPGEENAQGDAEMGFQMVPGSTVQLVMVPQMVMVENGIVMVQRIPVERIKRVFSIGGVMYYNDILPISRYPVIPTMFRHRRNPYPMSPVRFARPLQEYVNKLRSLIMAHAANSTNVKVMVNRGSIDKKEFIKEWQKAGTAVLEVDMEVGQPIIIGPMPLPNELYRNEMDAARDIQEIFGVYSFGQGDTAQAPDTYKGTVALDEFMQRRIRSAKDDIEAGLNQLAAVIVEYIQATYTEQKTLRLLQPNNAPITLELNKTIYDDFTNDIIGKVNDVTIGKYDVVFVAGSTLPVNRWARFEYYVELYSKGLIDREEVLKQTDVVDTEGVMRRMSEIEQMRQMIMGLQEELKSVKGDLQTANREMVHAQKRTEIEKFKTDLNTNSAKAEAATQLFTARLNDEVKNTRKELADRDRRYKASLE
jgi:hypothetical protein